MDDFQAYTPEQFSPDHALNVGGYFLSPKFDGYVIDGGAIRPKPGAKLSFYDLSTAFSFDFGRSRVHKPPYTALLNLKNKLVFNVTSRAQYEPTEQTIQTIVSWCGAFGLLGILPAIYDEFVLPAYDVGDPGRSEFRRLQSRFLRQGGGWHKRVTEKTGVLLVDSSGPTEEQLRYGQMPPTARVWRPEDQQWRVEELSTSLLRFFPTLDPGRDAHFDIPTPGSDRFWDVYAEPIEVFCSWTVRFAEAARILAAQDRFTETFSDEVARAYIFMDSLAGFLGKTVYVDQGRLRRVPNSPALLCTFAELFLRDIEAGHFLRSCETCTEFFIARERSIKYCSQRCRNTAQRRRDRAKT